jgi:alkylation response protein AidB-like acyl-CoA dehydrogenase
MRFALTEDQAALRDAARELLGRECPPVVVREAWEEGANAPRVAAAWSKLAEMGVVGAAVPEEAGGLGLGACDVVPLLEEAGRVALPLPIVETAFVAGPLLAAAGDEEAVRRIVAGELLVGCALDGAPQVPWAGDADLILVAERPGAAVRQIASAAGSAATDGGAFARFGGALEAAGSIDGARRLGVLVEPIVAADLGADEDACRAAWNRGALGAAAQLIGLSRALLAMTVTYAEERRQFGVPIGSFQAVKHHLANALLGLEFAAPAVLRAAWSLDTGADSADRDVAMAKALASEAAERVAATALQAHGAIAYTTEYDLHLFAKRVWASARTWGDAEWQRARVAAALGLDMEGSTR